MTTDNKRLFRVTAVETLGTGSYKALMAGYHIPAEASGYHGTRPLALEIENVSNARAQFKSIRYQEYSSAGTPRTVEAKFMVDGSRDGAVAIGHKERRQVIIRPSQYATQIDLLSIDGAELPTKIKKKADGTWGLSAGPIS